MSDDAKLTAELYDRARKMVPLLRERALEAAAQGALHDDTIQQMKDAGFFRIVQPKRWGGYELDPQVFFEVQMILAEGDMSAAWVLGVVAIHNWQMALFDDRAAQDVWGEDDNVLISSSYMPVGKVTRVEGGFKLSGRWGFSSGSKHCDWVFLGAMIPPLKEGDAPDMRTFLLPRKDYQIVDNWNTMGLRATGSHDIVVEDAFVPEYRTHKAGDGFAMQSPGNAVNTAPVFRIPFGQIFVRAVSTSAIGALRGAIAAYADVTSKRVGKNDGKRTASDPTAQYNLALAGTIADELRLVLLRNFDRLMEAARGGNPLTMEERIKMRYDSALVVERCVEGIDMLMANCGGMGTFMDHPVNKYFLDIHTGRGHVANTPEKFGRNWGAVQLGEPNTDFFL
ncbi:MAG: flavin-dependent monooxygenase [Gammaproteobacteria bacterium]|nr:MAG: flavin-dependent monooxygenase [Gammaproteobacteria bacterium]